MSYRFKKLRLVLPAALLLLSAAVFGAAQQTPASKHNARPETPKPEATTLEKKADITPATYVYEFKQPDFYVRYIRIEHDSIGRGRIIFERNMESTFEEPLQLSADALARIASHWQSLGFLDSSENYQADKQFPHLGTMFLTMEQNGRKRTAEFNWTRNKNAFALITEYRRLADQAIFVFDINVARETRPLNAPKLMELLESYLKRNSLSDPRQLLPLLKDLSTDEHIPLMARNHAARLVKQIEK